jgi:hypothetical protein
MYEWYGAHHYRVHLKDAINYLMGLKAANAKLKAFPSS